MEKHGRGKTPFFLTFFSTIPVDAFFLTLQGLFPLFHIFLHYGYLLLKTFYFFFFEKKFLHIKISGEPVTPVSPRRTVSRHTSIK